VGFERLYLHDNETLLCEQRSSGAALTESILRGVGEALILGVALSLILFVFLFFVGGGGGSVVWYVVLILVCFAVIIAKRFSVWRQSLFRITTERILLQHPIALFMQPVKTIKWPQYQESHVGGKSAFDFLFFSRPLFIRYGTADAKLEAGYPSLTWAHDLKHYLDKVDSAYRRGQAESAPCFVAAPRGKRDGAPPAVSVS
jgi:hypothetical protein